MDVDLRATVENIKYIVEEGICAEEAPEEAPEGAGTYQNGIYSGEVTVTAENTEGVPADATWTE